MIELGESPVVSQPPTFENPAWYALQTHSQREKYVSNLLTQRGIANYLPLYSETHRWSDRKKVVQLPLFTGYLFVNIPPASNEYRVRVLSVPGALHFVGRRNEAEVVTDAEIETVRTLISREIAWTEHPFLEAGMLVRIHGGPLDQVEGYFLKHRGKDKLVISIAAMARSLAVTVDSSYGIEVLSKPARVQ